jgi:prepilin-type N-terminal cleavage/methylation domain-containing protein
MRYRGERDDDSGFSLLEVVVAMAVFTVLATITLGILVNTTKVASGNIHRTAATNLLNTQLEIARSLTAQSIPDGRQVSTPTVGGTTYKVVQTASYVGTNATTSVCTGTGNSLAYKLVSVSITWPDMGNIKPVHGDTLRAVGVGEDGLDATKGTIAVSVVGSTGQATPDVVITLTPGGATQTTGDDGCAVFTGLAPGTYSAGANQVGYVGTANLQAATVNGLGIAAGGIGRGTLLYDTERSVNVVFDAPAGAIVPANLQLRIGDSYVAEAQPPLCATSTTFACITAVPGTFNNLFPESYTIKAGTCIESTPSSPSSVVADLRPVSANWSTQIVGVGAATVTVSRTGLPVGPITGRTVTFTHAAQTTTGCTSGETYTMSSVAAGSTLIVPYGTWLVSVPVLNASGLPVSVTSQSVTFGPSAKTANITLLVAL